MKVRDFNELKREVRKGDVKRLKEAIGELTLKQAQSIEDLMYDLKLTDEMNKVLDELVTYIDSLATEKVANKKALKAEKEPEKVEPEPAKTEVQAPLKEAPSKTIKPFNRVSVGDVVSFRVEGEERSHNILIVYKGKNNIVGIMEENEEEVFKIRRVDFNKLAFLWTDRHGNEYNIIVNL